MYSGDGNDQNSGRPGKWWFPSTRGKAAKFSIDWPSVLCREVDIMLNSVMAPARRAATFNKSYLSLSLSNASWLEKHNLECHLSLLSSLIRLLHLCKACMHSTNTTQWKFCLCWALACCLTDTDSKHDIVQKISELLLWLTWKSLPKFYFAGTRVDQQKQGWNKVSLFLWWHFSLLCLFRRRNYSWVWVTSIQLFTREWRHLVILVKKVEFESPDTFVIRSFARMPNFFLIEWTVASLIWDRGRTTFKW